MWTVIVKLMQAAEELLLEYWQKSFTSFTSWSTMQTNVRLKPTSNPANILIAALLPSLEESPAVRVTLSAGEQQPHVWDVLGALIVATSWIAGNVRSQSIAVNAVIVGILVMALGASEFLDLRRWEGGKQDAVTAGASPTVHAIFVLAKSTRNGALSFQSVRLRSLDQS